MWDNLHDYEIEEYLNCYKDENISKEPNKNFVDNIAKQLATKASINSKNK